MDRDRFLEIKKVVEDIDNEAEVIKYLKDYSFKFVKYNSSTKEYSKFHIRYNVPKELCDKINILIEKYTKQIENDLEICLNEHYSTLKNKLSSF